MHTKNMAEQSPFIFMGNVVPEPVADWYCAPGHLQCRVIHCGQGISPEALHAKTSVVAVHHTFSLQHRICWIPSRGRKLQKQHSGSFEGHNDVGTVLHAGSVAYDPDKHTYTISGSGENMWFAADAFQFVWKKMSGDVTLTADISFLTKTGNEHKKAVLMLRQSLDADSVYADVALHASGLTSLQFRDEKGALTREIQSNVSAPKRLRIAKRGDYVYMALASDGELQPAGGWLRIPLQGTFYVGLGVCSHDKDVVEQAVFSNVATDASPRPASGEPVLYSTLETVAIDSADRRVSYLSQGRFEAPNWTRDGSAFLFNREGRLERLAVNGDKPRSDRYRFRHALQQRPRYLAGWNPAGHQRQFAGGSRVARLHPPDHGRHAASR